MPEKVEECVRSVMDDNPDMSEDRAWAICKSQEQEGNLEDGAALADDCPENHVDINGECVHVENVNAPPGILQSEPRIMASASPLDTQPIEREELDGGKVAYRGLKLIDSGVWTDSASQTPTLYDERTFENTEPEIPNGHSGPPVNIAHDIHKNGPKAGDPHEASIGGYIDPDSLATDGEALFGDVILNTDESAGAFADDNLKSALENDGTAGFSPSVELMPTELEESDHREADEYVKAAELTGLGLVRDPASKSVDLQHETQNRSVALAASGESGKVLTRQTTGMRELMDVDELRETLDMFGFDGLDEMTDDEVAEMAADLHEDLMEHVQEGEESEMGDYEDDEEDEEEQEMADDEEEDEEEDEMEMQGAEEIADLREQLADLSERLADVEDAVGDKLSEGDVEQELADAAGDLVAGVESVEDLDKRLSALEDEPAEGKTLADASQSEDGFTPSYDDGPASPSNW